MLIPSKMNEIMSKYFYDKTITFRTKKLGVDDEGGRIEVPNAGTYVTVPCNIAPATSEWVKEKYGLDLNARLIITCASDSDVKPNSFFRYHEEDYEVVEVLIYDSHLKLVCR